jgi:hypothetical protein
MKALLPRALLSWPTLLHTSLCHAHPNCLSYWRSLVGWIPRSRGFSSSRRHCSLPWALALSPFFLRPPFPTRGFTGQPYRISAGVPVRGNKLRPSRMPLWAKRGRPLGRLLRPFGFAVMEGALAYRGPSAHVVGLDYSAPYRSLHMSALLAKRNVLSLGV